MVWKDENRRCQVYVVVQQIFQTNLIKVAGEEGYGVTIY